MSHRSTKRESGFSLLEVTIALGLGTLVLGAAVQLYTQGVNATWAASQRAELQQDFRAASNILTKDLSLAGAGLGQGAHFALPSTTAPVIGCAQTAAKPYPCYLGSGNNAAVSYPLYGGSTTYNLYGLIPGYDDGPTIAGSNGPTDAITVVYTDPTFYLDCYTANITATTATFTLIVPTAPATNSANCTSPTGNATAQAVNDSAAGLTPGDLVLFTLGTSSSANYVVAEVTAVSGTTSAGSAPSTSPYTVTFAAGDALNMNQPSTVLYSLAHQSTLTTTSATTGFASRLLVITYYLDNTPTPPRLMQQISGHTPVPVAENLAFLKFTYDLYNDTVTPGAVAAFCSDPGATSTYPVEGSSTDGCNQESAGLLPNQITKVNITNMAMNSTLSGGQFAYNGYQRMDLQTSVCPRNLTYSNNFQGPSTQ
jgi:type II secretory pathway pseudopilin PulG